MSGPLTAYLLVVCILEYELDLNGTGQDSYVANLSVRLFPGAGLKDGSNDHEGHMACVYVAPTWALLLLYKTSSC